jgi:CRP/FNR family cyclic AMP-dependent transcriptional regulator
MKNRKTLPRLSELTLEIPWVKALSATAQDRVILDAFDSLHQKGDVVACVGDSNHSWIFVLEGLLKVSATDPTGKMIMYTGVARGSGIGEGTVIKKESRRYDIIALRATRLLHLPEPTFRWLLDTSLEFNHFIISQLNERLSQFISMVEVSRYKDPVTRVAKSLAILFNPVLYPQMPTSVPLSQQELGDLVGLSRQCISAAVKALHAENLILIEYGIVIVKDVVALRNRKEHV